MRNSFLASHLPVCREVVPLLLRNKSENTDTPGRTLLRLDDCSGLRLFAMTLAFKTGGIMRGQRSFKIQLSSAESGHRYRQTEFQYIDTVWNQIFRRFAGNP